MSVETASDVSLASSRCICSTCHRRCICHHLRANRHSTVVADSASTHPYLRYGAKCLNTGIPTDARRSAAAARYRGRSPTRPPARPSSRNSEGRERVLRYRAPSSRRFHRHPRRRRLSRACCACCVISRCRGIVQRPSCYIETRRRACDDRVAVALESHRLNNKLVMPRRARARAGWGERVGAGWVNVVGRARAGLRLPPRPLLGRRREPCSVRRRHPRRRRRRRASHRH